MGMNDSSQAYWILAGVSGLAAQTGSRAICVNPTRSMTRAAASSHPITRPSAKVCVRCDSDFLTMSPLIGTVRLGSAVGIPIMISSPPVSSTL